MKSILHEIRRRKNLIPLPTIMEENGNNERGPGEGGESLPQSFNVKYLGFRECDGLWGIKHTRKPVDAMVAAAKQSKTFLNVANLVISEKGCKLDYPIRGGNDDGNSLRCKFYPVETVSYGVQDLVYTRIFSMIVVKDRVHFPQQSPFECHAFVCDSRQSARKVTHTLAAAFREYSKKVRAQGTSKQGKKFAVDLRTPEQMKMDLKTEDSEA